LLGVVDGLDLRPVVAVLLPLLGHGWSWPLLECELVWLLADLPRPVPAFVSCQRRCRPVPVWAFCPHVNCRPRSHLGPSLHGPVSEQVVCVATFPFGCPWQRSAAGPGAGRGATGSLVCQST